MRRLKGILEAMMDVYTFMVSLSVKSRAGMFFNRLTMEGMQMTNCNLTSCDVRLILE